LTSLRKGIGVSSYSFEAYMGIANTLRESGMYDNAIATHDKAIEIKANDFSCWLGKGLPIV
jgi:tetratricopeptide (TPR) repeat protein